MPPVRPLILASAVSALGACSDAPTPPQPTPSGSSLVLSEPIAMADVSASAPFRVAGRGGAAGTVVFLSLAPGSAPGGTTATLANVTTGLTIDTRLRGDGLDPVPVPASVGDSIVVTVAVPTGAPVAFGATVPASRPPEVVSTVPANGAIGIPRNRAPVVVFSEPVNPSTVGPSSIRLLRGGSAIAGTVTFLDSSHVAAVFTPSALLDANAGYQLVVSGTVADLDGDRLDADVTAEFTTGSTLLGPVAQVDVYPASITLPAERLVQYSALLTDAASDTLFGEPVAWATGDSTVAALAAIGVAMRVMVRGAGPGTTTITATSGAVSGTATVTVAAPLPLLAFAALGAGYDHTCAVTTAGVLYCWGGNNAGQLGNGGTTRSAYPSPVSGGLLGASVGTGFSRSCVLTATGAPWCWGDTSLTNIIMGSGPNVPAQVSGAPVLVTLTGGGMHACGLTAAGVAYCWGSNYWGQLGDPTTSGANAPRAVTGGLTFLALAAGGSHTCGIAADSTAWCWGYNGMGGLGDSSTSAAGAPVKVRSNLHFASLSAGPMHTCGVTASGALYCWGANGRGQLGAASSSTCPGQADAVATDACSLVPLRVTGIAAVRVVGAGYTHSCALTTAGAAYCWGENTYAQLGNGTRTDSPTPAPVSGSLTFASLTSAYYHSCGITTSGIAYCWGSGPHGELGDGASVDRTAPARVAGQQ